jgi:hypothetical protein
LCPHQERARFGHLKAGFRTDLRFGVPPLGGGAFVVHRAQLKYSGPKFGWVRPAKAETLNQRETPPLEVGRALIIGGSAYQDLIAERCLEGSRAALAHGSWREIAMRRVATLEGPRRTARLGTTDGNCRIQHTKEGCFQASLTRRGTHGSALPWAKAPRLPSVHRCAVPQNVQPPALGLESRLQATGSFLLTGSNQIQRVW